MLPTFIPTSPYKIVLTVTGAPDNYSGKHIQRLLIGAMTGPSRGFDIVSMRVDETGDRRTGELTVKGSLIPTLKIAGKSPECATQGCQMALELREWVLYVDSLPDDAASRVRVFPWPQFTPAEGLAPFFRQRDVFDVSLPLRRRNDLRRPHVQIYLFDQTMIQVSEESVGAKTDPTLLASGVREIALRQSSRSKWTLVHQPSSAAAGSAPATATPAHAPAPSTTPAPVARPLMYLVLEPKPVANWPAPVLVQRLKTILEGSSGFNAVVQAGGAPIPSRPPQFEVAGSKLIVWSGENQETATFRLENFPPFLTQEAVSAPVANGITEGRIQANQLVARSQITIPPALLSEKWQVSIEAVNRVYGKEQAARANELCEFNLRAKTANSVNLLDRLTKEDAFLRSSQNVDLASPLAQNAQLELEVKPLPGLARCVPQVVQLPPASVSWKWENNTPVASARVSLIPRGRWFLALYAPQGIGTGLPGGASQRSIFEAKNQILDWTTKYLDVWRERFFSESDPTRTALGFDLALVSGADAQSVELFDEASVLTGQYRQTKTSQFRIDRLGEQRLDAFLNGARGSGSAPSFDALEQAITRYSKLFAPLAHERPPIVFYVGAGAPTPDSCKDWARMAAAVPVRVFALAFVSSSAAMIGQDLGASSQAVPETSGQRPLGYSCKSENESLLLFAPFQDLVARAPDLVLDSLFRRMDELIGSRN